jgi:DNA-binding FrmR family transcriptional regulator
VAHAAIEKRLLTDRVRQLSARIEALEQALLSEEDCAGVMQDLTEARGLINALMAEVLEIHIRRRLMNPATMPTAHESEAAEKLIEILHSYI